MRPTPPVRMTSSRRACSSCRSVSSQSPTTSRLGSGTAATRIVQPGAARVFNINTALPALGADRRWRQRRRDRRRRHPQTGRGRPDGAGQLRPEQPLHSLRRHGRGRRRRHLQRGLAHARALHRAPEHRDGHRRGGQQRRRRHPLHRQRRAGHHRQPPVLELRHRRGTQQRWRRVVVGRRRRGPDKHPQQHLPLNSVSGGLLGGGGGAIFSVEPAGAAPQQPDDQRQHRGRASPEAASAPSGAGTFSISNTILAGNGPTNCSGALTSTPGYNLGERQHVRPHGTGDRPTPTRT